MQATRNIILAKNTKPIKVKLYFLVGKLKLLILHWIIIIQLDFWIPLKLLTNHNNFRHDDKYNLVLSLRDSNGKFREASITKSFANFIDTNGAITQNLVVREVTKIYNSLSAEKKEK